MAATGYLIALCGPRCPYPSAVLPDADVRIRALPTAWLSDADTAAVQALLTAAFQRDEHGGFTSDDWLHAVGGTHFVISVGGTIAGHASVVERALEIAGRPVRTGYVEAVAVTPALQRQGIGSMLMRAVNEHVAADFDLGALGTGSQAFYQRLGWLIWQGPTGVRVDGGFQPTPDEDGYILVLPTPTSPPFRLTDAISCDWRPGDVW
jgi:aminoglycoside 2'-N-acetyltransferase I